MFLLVGREIRNLGHDERWGWIGSWWAVRTSNPRGGGKHRPRWVRFPHAPAKPLGKLAADLRFLFSLPRSQVAFEEQTSVSVSLMALVEVGTHLIKWSLRRFLPGGVFFLFKTTSPPRGEGRVRGPQTVLVTLLIAYRTRNDASKFALM